MLGRSSSVRSPAMPVLDELPKFISQVALARAVSAEGLKGVEKRAASCAVLGWNPPCNGLCCASLRCTYLRQLFFLRKKKSYFSYVKVQYKNLLEKQGLKTLLLQQLWTGCDQQTQSP